MTTGRKVYSVIIAVMRRMSLAGIVSIAIITSWWGLAESRSRAQATARYSAAQEEIVKFQMDYLRLRDIPSQDYMEALSEAVGRSSILEEFQSRCESYVKEKATEGDGHP